MIKKVCLLIGFAALTQAAYAADLDAGKTLFEQRCATCHGSLGAGDGPVALSLPADQKPRDLAHGQMKYATDDAKLEKLIKEGGPAVGLNPLMPPQADLNDGDIASLALFVKSLKK